MAEVFEREQARANRQIRSFSKNQFVSANTSGPPRVDSNSVEESTSNVQTPGAEGNIAAPGRGK